MAGTRWQRVRGQWELLGMRRGHEGPARALSWKGCEGEKGGVIRRAMMVGSNQ